MKTLWSHMTNYDPGYIVGAQFQLEARPAKYGTYVYWSPEGTRHGFRNIERKKFDIVTIGDTGDVILPRLYKDPKYGWLEDRYIAISETVTCTVTKVQGKTIYVKIS